MRPIILMYHSVSEGDPIDPYGVSQNAFCNQILWLFDQGYQFVSLEALVRSGGNGLSLGRRKQAVLTFDDGYQDFLTNALPIMSFYRLPATVFLVTEMLGKTAAWSKYTKEASLMTEEDVHIVKAQDISLGSHTMSHIDLTSLEMKELRQQLENSRSKLAEFGETFFSFSYPWGKCSDREVLAVKAAGFDCAVAAEGAKSCFGSDPYKLGRIAMRRDMDLNAFRDIVSGPNLLWQIATLVRSYVRHARKGVLQIR